jgi:hypothetical protein
MYKIYYKDGSTELSERGKTTDNVARVVKFPDYYKGQSVAINRIKNLILACNQKGIILDKYSVLVNGKRYSMEDVRIKEFILPAELGQTEKPTIMYETLTDGTYVIFSDNQQGYIKDGTIHRRIMNDNGNWNNIELKVSDYTGWVFSSFSGLDHHNIKQLKE